MERSGTGGDPAPSRWRLLPLYCLVSADAAMLMVIAPFLPQMAAGRFGVPEERLGLATGLLTGIYSLANAAASPIIGHLVDTRWGRKTVLLGGTILSTCLTLILPNAGTLLAACVIRFCTGLVNHNVTTSRAFLADATRTDTPADRSVAFAHLGGAWGASRSFSAALSGLTVGMRIPGIPATENNPFLAPCLTMSALLAIVVVVSFFSLSEPPRPPQALEKSGLKVSTSLPSSLRRMVREGGRPLLHIIAAHALQQWSNGALLVLLVLLWNLPVEQGGHGLSTQAIGYQFAYFGLITLSFQLFAFKPLANRFASRHIYCAGATLLAAGVTLAPYAQAAPPTVMLLPMAIGFAAGLPILGGLIANAAPPQLQGLAQGTAQCTGMLARATGPVFLGTLFSQSVQEQKVWVPFAAVGACYTTCVLLIAGIPRDIESPSAGKDSTGPGSDEKNYEDHNEDEQAHVSLVDPKSPSVDGGLQRA